MSIPDPLRRVMQMVDDVGRVTVEPPDHERITTVDLSELLVLVDAEI